MTFFSLPNLNMEIGDLFRFIEIIGFFVLIPAMFANPHVKAFRKRKEKVRERSQISAIDWPKVKEAIEPAVRLGGYGLDHSCLFWATIAKEYLQGKVGLDTRIWKGKAGVSWVKRPNTEIRAKQRAYLRSATEEEEARMGTGTNYHVWLETKEYIIDLANYCKSEPCPDNLLVIRRDEPTVYYYIPDCEVLPEYSHGYPVYEIAGFHIQFGPRPITAFENGQSVASA